MLRKILSMVLPAFLVIIQATHGMGETLLHRASSNGDITTLRRLLQKNYHCGSACVEDRIPNWFVYL